jgi:hypothetical protein
MGPKHRQNLELRSPLARAAWPGCLRAGGARAREGGRGGARRRPAGGRRGMPLVGCGGSRVVRAAHLERVIVRDLVRNIEPITKKKPGRKFLWTSQPQTLAPNLYYPNRTSCFGFCWLICGLSSARRRAHRHFTPFGPQADNGHAIEPWRSPN